MRQDTSVYRAAAPIVEVFDTVGAGDAFNAGYLDAVASGQQPTIALQAGVRVASQIIARFPRPSCAHPATATVP